MGTHYISIMFPASPGVFGLFLSILTLYVAYSVIKVVVSLWTGA